MNALRATPELERFAGRLAGNRLPSPSPNGDNGEQQNSPPSPNGSNGKHHSSPSTNGSNGDGSGRDAHGRFAPGNKGGPGNPFARRVAMLRKLVLDTVGEDGLQAIVTRLVEAARCGDIPATRLVLAYAVGRPQNAVDPDRLDIEEWKLLMETGILPDQVKELLQKVPAGLSSKLVNVTWPCILHQGGQAALQDAGLQEQQTKLNNGNGNGHKAPKQRKRKNGKQRRAR